MIHFTTLAALLTFPPFSPRLTRSEEASALRRLGDRPRACHAISLLPTDEMDGWFPRVDRAAAVIAPVSLASIPQSDTYPHSGIVHPRGACAEIAPLTIDRGISLEDDELSIEDLMCSLFFSSHPEVEVTDDVMA